jgi:hypothetical protein
MSRLSSGQLLAVIRKKLLDSLRLYRSWWRELSLGVFIRVLTIIGILIAAIANPLFPDINDMNQLITLGILNMLHGLNPYERYYTLTALGVTAQDTYTQDFLNYGPMSLILHLPAMIFPWSFNGAGFMDMQPSFTILHGVFDFLIFDRLMRMKHRMAALFFWANPIVVTLDIVTPMSVPLFLLLMGYEKWEDPAWSAFWLGLGALTYQYIALLLLFSVAYHIRAFRKVLIGLLPTIAVFGVFQVWAMAEARPFALINDLFVVQFNRGYEPWFPNHLYSWYSWTGSVPAVTVNLLALGLGVPGVFDPLQAATGIRLSTAMNAGAAIVSVGLLLYVIWRPNYLRSVQLSFLSILLFLLSSPSGIWHHNFIMIIPGFFAFREMRVLLWKNPPTTTHLRTQKARRAT